LRELDADLSALQRTSPLHPLVHGQARLAVRTVDAPQGAGCKYCGLCLSGCPYGAIHATRDDAPALAARGLIEYQPGTIVRELHESATGVELSCYDTTIRSVTRRAFDRAFLGAGAINSTAIMLRSLNMFGVPVRLKDSQKFVLPFLRFGSTPVEWPAINSLAGLFIETKLPSLSDHWIHLQISTVNDYVLRRFGLDPLGRPGALRLALRPVLTRVMAAWCSLHSDHSSELDLTVHAPAPGAEPVLEIRNRIHPQAEQHVRRVALALARAGLRFQSLFLAPFVQSSLPGSGGHTGGSFPMSTTAREGTWSDLLGRPMGWQRVHLVDASIFPSIPGTTVVLPIMANADRIASLAPLS
jgi:choline dehydrogenase-like flavoprotein